jgi:hypothetical protein
MKISHVIRFVVATAALYAWAPSTANAQCEPLNCNDTVSDRAALQCLLDNSQGGSIVLPADGCAQGYYIGRPGLTLSVPGTTLTSTSAFGNRALLVATPDLNVPMLTVAGAVSNYTISNIWFWGNKLNRTTPDCRINFNESANLVLTGSFWLLDNIESDYVPCQTSTMVLPGASSFEIKNSWFANNGFDMGGGSCTASRCWADGLTVDGCFGGNIHNNNFLDNTDIDLVVGGGNCTVQNNTIQHFNTYGFGGLHVGWFNGGGGDHSGSIYSGNNISSALNKLGFGVVVGKHPWNVEENLTNAGSVTSNGASGSVINLAIEGISGGGQVTGNNVSGAQGIRGFGGCTTDTVVPNNYIVYHPHAGSATLQSGSIEVQFDSNTGCVRQ